MLEKLRNLGYIRFLYYGAAVFFILHFAIYAKTYVGGAIALTVSALSLDAAVILDMIRRIRGNLSKDHWAFAAVCAALAFTIAAVATWMQML